MPSNALVLRLPRGWILPIAAALATFAVGAMWTGSEDNVFLPALLQWLQAGSIALLWVAMSLGFGSAIATLLRLRLRRASERIAVELALGVAAACALDVLFGSFGLLLAGGGLVLWGVTAAGMLLLIMRLRRDGLPSARRPTPLALAALGCAAGVLLLAATSEPGWLWDSEFGGYDALSYHLELPKEWLAAGGIATLRHNVYSAFPSFMEAAYLHLFGLAGGPIQGAIAAQCLAALLTLGATLAVACAARRVAGTFGAVVAAALYLGTPWVVVVGSLAYNDGAVGLFLAAGFLVVTSARGARGGVALGLLLAGAIGSKLTALGFCAAPLLALLVMRRRTRALVPAVVALATCAVLLAPWLLRNWLATSNPTFPFLTSLFGTGHWTAEQAAIFAKGHASAAPLGERLGRLFDQWLRLGFGANPVAGEPWDVQWSVLPFLGLVGLVVLAFARRTRGAAAALAVVLALQVTFWLAATHLQSRFLLPTAVPLAIAGAAALRAALRQVPRNVAAWTAPGALLLWCLVPLHVFGHQRLAPDGGSYPATACGSRSLFSGDAAKLAFAATTDPQRKQAILNASPALLINHVLPAASGEKPPLILFVGEAAPFHYRGAIRYATVWDRGPLDELIARMPDAPQLWPATLARDGYRFVYLDPRLIERWARSGWLNPEFTPARLQAFLRGCMPVWPDEQTRRGDGLRPYGGPVLFELPAVQ